MKVANPVRHENETNGSRFDGNGGGSPRFRIERGLRTPRVTCSVLVTLLLALSCIASQPPAMELEAILVWGTNDQKSPEPSHKPVGPELRKRLQALPLKWTNYFEVKRIKFEVPPAGVNKIPLSEKCALEVKNQGHEKIVVSVFGKGKQVATRTQELPKHGTLILGGDSPGTNCWLAVVKRLN